MSIHNTATTRTIKLRFSAQAVSEQLDHTKPAPLHKLTMSDRAELYSEDKMGHQQPYEESDGNPGLWLSRIPASV